MSGYLRVGTWQPYERHIERAMLGGVEAKVQSLRPGLEPRLHRVNGVYDFAGGISVTIEAVRWNGVDDVDLVTALFIAPIDRIAGQYYRCGS